jgi:hypothetical protein
MPVCRPVSARRGLWEVRSSLTHNRIPRSPARLRGDRFAGGARAGSVTPRQPPDGGCDDAADQRMLRLSPTGPLPRRFLILSRAGGVQCRSPSILRDAAVINCGDFVNKRQYHQARRQREDFRKARQQRKLQRRLDRTNGPDGIGVTETSWAESKQPIDPAEAPSS